MAACGLDFGTSNTTLGHRAHGGPALLPLEGSHVTVPSAIFFEPRRDPLIGRAATAAYVAGKPGRLMRGLKSVLGTPLIEEATPVGRERLRLRDVIARYIAIVKARAEEQAGTTFDAVVHGRPVHFVDGDPEGDRRAENVLREIAREVGFRDIAFQYEPIAAALDYERQVEREEIALIADIGGGTSDFSIVRLSPERRRQADRAADILANDGVRIGGTDFDRQLSLATVMPLLGFGSPMKRGDLDVPGAYYHDLATWSAINRLYDGRTLREIDDVLRDCARPDLVGRLRTAVEEERGHALAGTVEAAKIAASETGDAAIDLGPIERGLSASLDRSELATQTDGLARAVAARIGTCLRQANLPAERIDALFLTGGSTGLPHLRAALAGCLPEARIVAGDTFGSVGLGLTIAAETLAGRSRADA
ncbi:MAG: Hsp70 family protein [Methylobacterium sp.]